jgi:hypothetical protein
MLNRPGTKTVTKGPNDTPATFQGLYEIYTWIVAFLLGGDRRRRGLGGRFLQQEDQRDIKQRNERDDFRVVRVRKDRSLPRNEAEDRGIGPADAGLREVPQRRFARENGLIRGKAVVVDDG